MTRHSSRVLIHFFTPYSHLSVPFHLPVGGYILIVRCREAFTTFASEMGRSGAVANASVLQAGIATAHCGVYCGCSSSVFGDANSISPFHG